VAWTYRTLCDVLEEARACYETRNFAPLLGLIEEVQAMGNRMEAGLEGKKDYDRTREKVKELEAKKRKLENQISKLNSDLEELGKMTSSLDQIYEELYWGE
jgi:DNA repair exonuclease SbcCD ATPase subunit